MNVFIYGQMGQHPIGLYDPSHKSPPTPAEHVSSRVGCPVWTLCSSVTESRGDVIVGSIEQSECISKLFLSQLPRAKSVEIAHLVGAHLQTLDIANEQKR